MWTFSNCWPLLLLRHDWTSASLNCEISSAETELERPWASCPQEWLWLFLSNTETSAPRVTVRDIIYFTRAEKQKITASPFQSSYRAKELTGFFLPPWHKSSLLTMCLVPQKTLQSNTALIKEKPRITNNYPHKIKILPTLNQRWHVKWIIFSTLLCLFFFSLPKCVSCMSKLNIKEDQANSQFVGAFVGAF